MYTAFVLEVTVINGRYTATDTAPVPPPLTTKISELVTHIQGGPAKVKPLTFCW